MEVTIPGDITATLRENTGDDVDGLSELFALAHLREPDLGVEGDREDDDEGEVPCVDFTDEEDEDELF